MDERQKSIHIPADPADPCPPACPGCAHRHLPAAESRTRKQVWLTGRLAPWADRLRRITVPSGAGGSGYRRKVCLSAAWDEKKGWQFGLRRQKRVIPIHDCPVHAVRVRTAVTLFTRRLPPFPQFPLVYFGQSGAQVTLVVKTGAMPPSGWLTPEIEALLRRAGIEGLWVNLHPGAGRRVFSRNGWQLVWGASRSIDEGGLVYGPTAFQQQIPALYRMALDDAENFLNPVPPDRIVDLYCGIGASLKRWTGRGCAASGVERDGEAVGCANLNAPDAVVFRGKCRDRIPQLDPWISRMGCPGSSRRLYANPPRTGLEPEVIDWIARSCRPDRMAYLSCSAGTLSRDLILLEKAGYWIEHLIPYDFFPGTLHVETLACLKKTG